MKYLKMVRETFSGREFFSVAEAWRLLAGKGISRAYIKLLVHNLEKKGEIQRLARGVYTFRPETSCVAAVFSPSYHGLQEALSIHKIWGQATNQVIVTPRKIRAGERSVAGRKAIVRRISRKMFFGFETVNYGGEWFTVSDIEKTLMDFMYYREPIDNETAAKLLKRIDKEKLCSYLRMAGKKTGAKIAAAISGLPKGVRPLALLQCLPL